MNPRARRDPDGRAEEVLRAYGQSLELPINVKQIANALGAEIRYSNLDEDLSGILVRDGKRIIIGVASDQPSVRQRYTIAHELGHLLMHPGRPYLAESLGVVRVDRRGSETPGFADQREEREANQFAAALLMPAQHVTDSWFASNCASDETSIKVLAKRFDVSSLAMKYRLLNLGLIGPHNTVDDH